MSDALTYLSSLDIMTTSDNFVKELLGALTKVAPEQRIGVAFSGGIDSSLLARLCALLGKDFTLLTIGFSGAHDLSFSSEIASRMRLRHVTLEISPSDFRKDMQAVLSLVQCSNTSHIENCIAYREIGRLARNNGLSVVLSANGFDELYCGYHAYRAIYDKGHKAIMDFMEEKIRNELELVAEISLAVLEFGVSVRQPFLSSEFVKMSKTIPLEDKIRGSDDLLRKHVLRKVALELGVPEQAAMKPKKALQYGSLVHRNFKKLRSEPHSCMY